MTQKKICFQLDVTKKIKIKIDENFRILYVNDYYTEISGFKVSEIILKPFDSILDATMPKITMDLFEKTTDDFSKFYFVIKGKIKNNNCFWSFIKVTRMFNKYQEFSGYLLEGKLLPSNAIQQIEKMFSILTEIENNAGKDAALKYINGYLEEKNMNFNDFVLAIAEVNEKKAEKYFEIDVDASTGKKKKKRSWF